MSFGTAGRTKIPTARLYALNVTIGMFFLFGTFSWIIGIFIWFFIPETKGVSLEKMDELFDVTKLVEKDVEDASEKPVNEIRGHNVEKA
ncbi:hypothetical protein MFIFM68171_06669 [Madurella fahalii]|uniref:Uncharacterized protein n=1 Tax=Madurella fahalii TaxID=1157608 RepID=A0ABQ0GFF2_9PEZI